MISKYKCYLKCYLYPAIFTLAILLQLAFWYNTRDMKPQIEILPLLPGKDATLASSFGDEEFYFRVLGLEMQNAGDGFGTVTPLKDYDYELLSKWFSLLDSLNSESNFIPAVASYYYGMTQYEPDTIYLIDYLYNHSVGNLKEKWWWMIQAVNLANYRLKDKQIALQLAEILADDKNITVPMWVKQLPAIIKLQLGERDEAFFIIKKLLENEKNLSDEELNFMYFFIKDRLNMQDRLSNKYIK